MTEPQYDPITTILITVTEIRRDLAAALGRLEQHQTLLDRHSATLVNHGERLTGLEARNTADDGNTQRSYSGRTVLWGAMAALVSVVSTVVAIVLAVRGSA